MRVLRCVEWGDMSDSSLGTVVVFLSKCSVNNYQDQKQINILRGSEALQSLMLDGMNTFEKVDKKVLVKFQWVIESVLIVKVHLQSDLFCGSVLVAVVSELLVP